MLTMSLLALLPLLLLLSLLSDQRSLLWCAAGSFFLAGVSQGHPEVMLSLLDEGVSDGADTALPLLPPNRFVMSSVLLVLSTLREGFGASHESSLSTLREGLGASHESFAGASKLPKLPLNKLSTEEEVDCERHGSCSFGFSSFALLLSLNKLAMSGMPASCFSTLGLSESTCMGFSPTSVMYLSMKSPPELEESLSAEKSDELEKELEKSDELESNMLRWWCTWARAAINPPR